MNLPPDNVGDLSKKRKRDREVMAQETYLQSNE